MFEVIRAARVGRGHQAEAAIAAEKSNRRAGQARALRILYVSNDTCVGGGLCVCGDGEGDCNESRKKDLVRHGLSQLDQKKTPADSQWKNEGVLKLDDAIQVD